ncbi:MAG TPA: hypothetical protein VF929_06145 [Gemmatimonadaceae bacterium]
MSEHVNHQELVKKLLDAKTVDFAAIGKVAAAVGPALALADEPWEGFCGTMQHFIRLYIVNPHPGFPVDNLGALRAAAGELKSR